LTLGGGGVCGYFIALKLFYGYSSNKTYFKFMTVG
jgi:hypothetical protein